MKLEVSPRTLLKLPHNWVVCIEKVGPNNFPQVTAILDNLYWKQCQLMKNVNEIPEIEVFLGTILNFTINVLTWGLANNDNICKKILSNLVNTTIN